MSIFSLIFILFCLLMHACNARHLLLHDAFALKHFSPKVVEKVEVGSDSVQVSANSVTKEEELKGLSKEMKLHGKGENSGVIPTKSLVSVSHDYYKKRDEHPEFYSDYSRPRTRMVHEGIGIVESSSVHMGLQKTTKTEAGSSWRGGHGEDEVNNYNSVNEGFMETDYDPPHRKSPIHNK